MINESHPPLPTATFFGSQAVPEDTPLFTADQMRSYADATCALRGAQKEEPAKSLNAKAADLLRPFLKEGEKVIWREPFRWHDDNGVLANHYDSMGLASLSAEFGYQVDWDTNLYHAAIVRPSAPTPEGEAK